MVIFYSYVSLPQIQRVYLLIFQQLPTKFPIHVLHVGKDTTCIQMYYTCAGNYSRL
jgi:hypothetical protein